MRNREWEKCSGSSASEWPESGANHVLITCVPPFLHGGRHACVRDSTQRTLYSRLHLPPPTPSNLLLPRAAFLYIFARSSGVFLKLFCSVEIHQARRRENNGGARVNRVPFASEKTMVAELLSPFLFHHIACTKANGLFLSSFFILHPPGSLVDRWKNITYFLVRNGL